MGQITATRNLVAIKVVRHAGQLAHLLLLLDLNWTSFSMAMRESTLCDFGQTLVRLCHCLLSEAMQIKAFESL